MAFNVSALSEFTERAKQILEEGLLYNDSYSNFSTQSGIKHKEYLNYIDDNCDLQAGVCDLDDSGDTTFTQKTVQVYPMSNLKKWCLSDLDQKDISAEIGTGKGKMVNDFKTALISQVVAKQKIAIDEMIFQGDTASGSIMDGLTTKFSADPTVIDVVGSAVTSSTIDDYIEEMLLAATTGMLSRGKLTLHVPLTYYNLYRVNRIHSNQYHDDPKNKGLLEMSIFGWEGIASLKAEPGLVGSTQMFLSWDRNIVMLYDEVNEQSRAEMFFDKKERNVYYSASWKLGVDYYFGNEVVLFTVS